MSTATLLDSLGKRASDEVVLVSGDHQWSVETLQQVADRERANREAWRNGRFALLALGAADLLQELVILDGFAGSILLVPTGLDEKTAGSLVAQHDTDVIVHTGCRLEPRQQMRDRGDGTTRWVLATSGTTGTPKLIDHRFATVTRTVKAGGTRGASLRWGLVYDPARFAGLQVLLQGVIGGSQLAVSLDPHPSDISAMLLANAVNAISATPSMWRRLLMDPKIHKLSLAQITLGGEIADQAVLDALGRAFPAARITHIYASTEAGVGFAVSDRREGFPADWLRGDGPVPMKVDARGHLWLKPDHLPTGDAVVSRTDASGFLDTEDVVQVDQHRVRFAGRASGAINVGGQKAHPEEIEGVIRSVPGVVDVVVYGKKSSMMGQLVTADVVAEPDVDATALKSAIAGECRRQLPNWKVPATIRLVGSLTETAAGKRVRAL